MAINHRMPRFCSRAIALAILAICISSPLRMQLRAGDLPKVAEPSLLSPWNDPANLVITGNSSFDRAAILRALAADIDVQLASSTDDGGAAYETAVQHFVVDGYKNAGFADVVVDCRIDRNGEKTRLAITEGQPYRCGEIQVVGAVKIPRTKLIRRLQEPFLPLGARIGSYTDVDGQAVPKYVDEQGNDVELVDPIWPAGKPAALNTGAIIRDEGRVIRALNELGYPGAGFRLEPSLDRSKHVATVVVHILNEGPDPSVGKIVVTGNRINTEKTICDFLRIRPGVPYSGEAAQKWNELLWRSGRFVRSNISATSRDDGERGLKLSIDVVELKVAPPLDKPLSPEAIGMLKLRDWIVECRRRGDDFVLEGVLAGKRSWGAIVSEHGFIFYDGRATPNEIGTSRFEHAFIASTTQCGFYNLVRSTKHEFELHDPVLPQCNLSLFVPEDAEQQGEMNFGFGFGPDAEKYPKWLSIDPQPVAFVESAYRQSRQIHLAGSVLTTNNDWEHLCFDVQKGELLKPWLFSNETTSFQISFQRGKFDAVHAQIQQAAAKLPNRANLQKPISSSVSAIGENAIDIVNCYATDGDDMAKRILVWQKFLSQIAIAPLDDWFSAAQEQAPELAAFHPDQLEQKNWLTACSIIMLATANDSFVRGTWPWVLERETAFGMQQKESDWNRLEPIYRFRQIGPVGCLAFAAGLRGYSPFAGRFASQGLLRLSLADFQNDYRLLLDQRCLVGRAVFVMADALRDLSPQETETLCESFPPETGKLVQDFARQLRSDPKRSLAESLHRALDELWVDSLSAEVKSGLETLAGR